MYLLVKAIFVAVEGGLGPYHPGISSTNNKGYL